MLPEIAPNQIPTAFRTAPINFDIVVYLSDGVVNLALLKYKNDKAAGEDRGKDYVGPHHLGFWVDNVEATRKNIEEADGRYYMGEVPEMSNIFYEVKFRDPNNVIIDVTQAGWGGASKDGSENLKGPKLRHEGLTVKKSAG